MQEAIPFRTYFPGGTAASINGGRNLSARDSSDQGAIDSTSGGQVLVLASNGENFVQKLVSENSIIVFGQRGCCMCHVVKRLLLGLGVNPPVYEVDEKEEGPVIKELTGINGGGTENIEEGKDMGQVIMQFPVVFVGGKLFGGLERIMATHISGELVPILKDAGALWL